MLLRCPLTCPKARFQGQFLSDEDVGLPSAPKRPAGQAHLNLGGMAPGNGRLGASSSAANGAGAAGGAAGAEDLAARRKRLGLGEGRHGDRSPRAATTPGAEVPLLEIRPKRAPPGSAPAQQPSAAEPAASTGAAASPASAASNSVTASPARTPRSGAVNGSAGSSSGAGGGAPAVPVRRLGADGGADTGRERNVSPGSAGGAGPGLAAASGVGARVGVTPQGGLRIGLNGSSPEIGDSELQQSLLLRGQLHYVHPSVASVLPGTQASVQQQQQVRVARPEPAAGSGSTAASTKAGIAVPATSKGPAAGTGSGMAISGTSSSDATAPTATTGRAAGPIAPMQAATEAKVAGGIEEAAAADVTHAAPTLSQEDADEALYLPVSGVSMGLLRGASRVRKATERANTSGSKAAAHDTVQQAAPEMAPAPAQAPLQEMSPLAEEPAAGAPKTGLQVAGAVDALLQLMRRPNKGV